MHEAAGILLDYKPYRVGDVAASVDGRTLFPFHKSTYFTDEGDLAVAAT
jgi:hypothetical protein